MLDNIAQAVTEHDLASMSEAEVDQFFEQFEPRGTGLEPYFEDFLGGLWKKAKSVREEGARRREEGPRRSSRGSAGCISQAQGARPAAAASACSGRAIDKLPPTLRPVARQLAQRVLGTNAPEVQGEDFAAAPARPTCRRSSSSSTSRPRR